jgi:hypothetical protein
MKTTSRKFIRNNDVFYDGTSFGTPIGQIMFIWDNVMINVYHDEKLIFYTEYVSEARKEVNRLISIYFHN